MSFTLFGTHIIITRNSFHYGKRVWAWWPPEYLGEVEIHYPNG